MKKDLIISMNRDETVGGWVLMACHLVLLPALAQLVGFLLPGLFSAAVLNFLYFLAGFGAAALIFRKFLRKNWVMTKLRPGYTLQSAAIGFLGYYLGNMLFALISAAFLAEFQNINDSAVLSLARENYALTAIGAVFLAPVTEELLYRGVLFQGFYRKNPVTAYALSTAVFSLIHVVRYVGLYEPRLLFLCFLQYIPAGLCLAWAYARSNTIFSPILMHMAINAMGITSVR